jgi:hypothetical protein
MLQKWLKNVDSIRMFALQRGINPYYRLRCPGSGRPSLIPIDVEERFLEWFHSKRSENNQETKGPIKINIHMCIAAIRKIDNNMVKTPRHLLRRRLWRMFH